MSMLERRDGDEQTGGGVSRALYINEVLMCLC